MTFSTIKSTYNLSRPFAVVGANGIRVYGRYATEDQAARRVVTLSREAVVNHMATARKSGIEVGFGLRRILA